MATEGKVEKYPNRWIQLVLGIICMATVANCQYGWTLFVAPMQDKWGWSRTSIQLAFTIFIFFGGKHLLPIVIIMPGGLIKFFSV